MVGYPGIGGLSGTEFKKISSSAINESKVVIRVKFAGSTFHNLADLITKLSSKLVSTPPLIFGNGFNIANYRPINSISFLSKIIEKCVEVQLIQHLKKNNMILDRQSAYKKNHSCETALIKICDDILIDLNSDSSVMMAFLDLSAAFDTVDHSILLNKLQHQYAIDGTVIHWFASYLQERKFHVKIDDNFSNGRVLKCGVPQGSVLGPLLFALYTQEIHKIFNQHNVQYHMFADDVQIYTKYTQDSNSILTIKNCIKDIKKWTDRNYLKLNESKTQFIMVTSERSKLNISESYLLNNEITLSNEIKNLGCKIDHNLNFKNQINEVCRYGFAMLKNLWRTSSKLSAISVKIQIVHSCILSKIDYCNSLYMDLPKCEIKKLQRLMNGSVRYIYKLKRDPNISITEYLKKCHFLPVALRIQFKICTLVYKCINGIAPHYLMDLLKIKESLQSLRVYSDSSLLHVPNLDKLNYKNRRFTIVASRAWNDLPKDLRDIQSLSAFKAKLKHYFFEKF